MTQIAMQYSDWFANFTGITRDGTAINMSGVSAWIFGLSDTTFTNTYILKASTGASASGDFVIDSGNRNVTVSVRASEFGYRSGNFNIALYAASGSRRLTHDQKFITIKPQINSSGV